MCLRGAHSSSFGIVKRTHFKLSRHDLCVVEPSGYNYMWQVYGQQKLLKIINEYMSVHCLHDTLFLLFLNRRCYCFSVQFLVQSFFETLQYCDEWRKFTSVSDSVSHSVNSGGGGGVQISNTLLKCYSYKV